MRTTIGRISFVVLASAFSAIVGCSSSDSGGSTTDGGSSTDGSPGGGDDLCAVKSKCPSDPPESATDLAACRKLMADSKCGSLFRAYVQCAIANQTCDASGKDDGNYGGKCTSQSDASDSCQGI